MARDCRPRRLRPAHTAAAAFRGAAAAQPRSPTAALPHPGPHPPAPRKQNQGNEALKTGLRAKKKFYLRQAIEQYGKGLELQCADAPLNSVLCSNRAHVNLLLGNFRNAYQDGLAALRHNDQNIKVGWAAWWWVLACVGAAGARCQRRRLRG